MAEIQPPLYVNESLVYGSDELGQPFRDLIGEGVVEAGDLLVSQRPTPNLSVDVAAGVAWIRGDFSPAFQPTYLARNDAVVNLAIAAGDPTNPRIDLVIAEVRDDLFDGTSKDWRLRVVQGTPAASPSPPALPNSAHKLAEILVPATASQIVDADITDTRARAHVGGGAAVTPRARVVRTSDQAITGEQAVSFQAADEDEGFFWDAGQPTRLTFRQDGAYLVGGTFAFVANATGYRRVKILLNGTTVLDQDQESAQSGVPTIVRASTLVIAAAADYVEFLLFHNAGGALNLDFEAGWTPHAYALKV